MRFVVVISCKQTSGAGTAYPSEHLSSPPVLSGVRFSRPLVLCVCFVDRCLSFCTFLFWPLCCLFFFNIWILITSLVSLNPSYCLYIYCLCTS